MYINKQLKLKTNERGIVSIVLTVFVLVVLSLVVVAFSQNSRRESRQALDRQLSTQAFYAAESGINDTISKIRSGTVTEMEETDCNNGAAARVLDNNTANGGQNAFTISCLLFDRHPPDVQWSAVNTGQGEFVSLQTEANDLNKIKVTWTRSEGGNNQYGGCVDTGSYLTSPSSASAPEITTNCSAGIIRLTLIPVGAGEGREAFYDNSYTVFLRPTSNAIAGGAQQSYVRHNAGADTQGSIIPAFCTNGGRCEATINGLPSGGSVYAQVRSIYYPNAVDIIGYNVLTQPIKFTQAQVKIDVTGKASDVLRRVQVRMPLYEKYTAPADVLDVMQGVCKRLGVYPQIAGGPAAYANNDECGGL